MFLLEDDSILKEDEREAWFYVSRDVKPLKNKALVPPSLPKKKPRTPSVSQPRFDLFDKPSSKAPLPYLEHGENVGVDKATAKRLLGGKFAIEATLDLHGHRLDTAFGILQTFLQRCYTQGIRGVLIVTGKGSGSPETLKTMVPRWFNTEGLRDYVLMFSHAQAKHGGQGALYVWLKKRNKN